MNRMKSSQIIMPNTAEPPTAAPLMRNPEVCSVSTMRKITARNTGAPSSRPRKTERLDHSICPSDRSKTRIAEAKTDTEVRGAECEVRGAESEVRGAGGEVGGAESEVRGAECEMLGAEGAVRGASSLMPSPD